MSVATKEEWLEQGREAVKYDRLVIVNKIIFAITVGFLLAAAIAPAFAEPLFRGEGQGVVITLFNEPCRLDAVTNLPYRITWEEKGKTVEGCFAPREDAGVVVGYFADKTVALMPVQMFVKVTGV